MLEVSDDFARMGLRPGSRLAILARDDITTVVRILAALRSRLVVGVIDSRLARPAQIRRLRDLMPEHVLGPAGWQAPCADLSRDHVARRDVDSVLVLWTTGSTGAPKAVALGDEAVSWNARANADELGVDASDRAIILLNLASAYGLVGQVFTHLLRGAAIILPRAPIWTPAFRRAWEQYRPTTTALVPALLRALTRARAVDGLFRTLRLATVGGARAPIPLLRTAALHWPALDIRVTYGLTEAGPRVCTARLDIAAHSPGFVGTPLPGISVSLSPVGELLVRTPSAALGTFSRGVLVRSTSTVSTGDLAELDGTGNVWIRGRIKTMINCGGTKVSPTELEEVLLSHPGVLEARAFPKEHRVYGEVPAALVVRRSDNTTAAAIHEHCRTRLGPTIPHVSITFVSELPPGTRTWKDFPQHDSHGSELACD